MELKKVVWVFVFNMLYALSIVSYSTTREDVQKECDAIEQELKNSEQSSMIQFYNDYHTTISDGWTIDWTLIQSISIVGLSWIMLWFIGKLQAEKLKLAEDAHSFRKLDGCVNTLDSFIKKLDVQSLREIPIEIGSIRLSDQKVSAIDVMIAELVRRRKLEQSLVEFLVALPDQLRAVILLSAFDPVELLFRPKQNMRHHSVVIYGGRIIAGLGIVWGMYDIVHKIWRAYNEQQELKPLEERLQFLKRTLNELNDYEEVSVNNVNLSKDGASVHEVDASNQCALNLSFPSFDTQTIPAMTLIFVQHQYAYNESLEIKKQKKQSVLLANQNDFLIEDNDRLPFTFMKEKEDGKQKRISRTADVFLYCNFVYEGLINIFDQKSALVPIGMLQRDYCVSKGMQELYNFFLVARALYIVHKSHYSESLLFDNNHFSYLLIMPFYDVLELQERKKQKKNSAPLTIGDGKSEAAPNNISDNCSVASLELNITGQLEMVSALSVYLGFLYNAGTASRAMLGAWQQDLDSDWYSIISGFLINVNGKESNCFSSPCANEQKEAFPLAVWQPVDRKCATPSLKNGIETTPQQLILVDALVVWQQESILFPHTIRESSQQAKTVSTALQMYQPSFNESNKISMQQMKNTFALSISILYRLLQKSPEENLAEIIDHLSSAQQLSLRIKYDLPPISSQGFSQEESLVNKYQVDLSAPLPDMSVTDSVCGAALPHSSSVHSFDSREKVLLKEIESPNQSVEAVQNVITSVQQSNVQMGAILKANTTGPIKPITRFLEEQDQSVDRSQRLGASMGSATAASTFPARLNQMYASKKSPQLTTTVRTIPATLLKSHVNSMQPANSNLLHEDQLGFQPLVANDVRVSPSPVKANLISSAFSISNPPEAEVDFIEKKDKNETLGNSAQEKHERKISRNTQKMPDYARSTVYNTRLGSKYQKTNARKPLKPSSARINFARLTLGLMMVGTLLILKRIRLLKS